MVTNWVKKYKEVEEDVLTNRKKPTGEEELEY